ncbi:MAG: ExbD/TolR family protein [Phycisphaerae bacterium]
MAKKKGKVAAGEVSINLTPMIDCTFQLIIFFILTTQFASAALAPLLPPKPADSVAVERAQDPDQVMGKTIVNVVSKVAPDAKKPDPMEARKADHYFIAGYDKVRRGDEERLTKIFKDEHKNAKEAGVQKFFIEIRGDKRVTYSYVQPVMMAAAKAGIPEMNITALVKTGTK